MPERHLGAPAHLVLARVRALLIDLDGVVYRGDAAMPGAGDLGSTLAELGLRYVFVTNNSALSPAQFAEKLGRIGVPVEPEHVVTSAQATAEYLTETAPAGTRVLVIGEEGLRRALEEAGFALVEDQPAVVVVGLDRGFTYQKLARACVAIRAGARFVATNPDPALPVEGAWLPGAGSLVAAVATAAAAEPVVIGKPAPTLLHVALKRLDVQPAEAAMVGDQILTDVRAGRSAGLVTVLVGSDQPTPDAEPGPDLWVPDLPALWATLRQAAESRWA